MEDPPDIALDVAAPQLAVIKAQRDALDQSTLVQKRTAIIVAKRKSLPIMMIATSTADDVASRNGCGSRASSLAQSTALMGTRLPGGGRVSVCGDAPE